MKVPDWERVVVTWANVLKLIPFNVNTVSELFETEFFAKLLEELGCSIPDENYEAKRELKSFLEAEFKSFSLLSEEWDHEETVLATSLLLLSGSLRCQKLRTPLYGLCQSTQLLIQAFIQKFISTPPHLIDRGSLLTSLLDIASEDGDESPSEDDNSAESPVPSLRKQRHNPNQTPNVKYLSQAKVKSLECKLEVLDWDKQHLQDEVDALKSDLEQLSVKYKEKNNEVLKLQNELFLYKSNHPPEDIIKSPDSETRHLKQHIDSITVEVESLKDQLDAEQTSNAKLRRSLKAKEEEKVVAELKCVEAMNKITALEATVADLEVLVQKLKSTCKEQAELLKETSFTYFRNDESFPGYPSETLAPVIEIRCSELEDQVKSVTEDLNRAQLKISSLEQQISTKNSVLQSTMDRLKEKENELSNVLRDHKEVKQELDELNEDNKFLIQCLNERKIELNERQTELNILKNEREFDSGYKSNSPDSSGMTQMDHLVEGKQICIDEAHSLNKRLMKQLSDRDSLLNSLSEENDRLRLKLTETQTRFSSLQNSLLDRAASLPGSFTSPEEALDALTALANHSVVTDYESQVFKLEQIIEGKSEEISFLKKTVGKADAEMSELRLRIRSCESEIENLRGDLRVRGTTVLALEQAVSMCEHEKAILQRRIDLLTHEKEKLESLKSELSEWKSKFGQLENELENEKITSKSLRNRMEVDQKLNNAFDAKLSQLQAQMKSHYEKEISKTVEEYQDKILKMKRKMLKDKSHIEDLSSDLWETSDRYLLLSQEADALRNQLRKTRAALDNLTGKGMPIDNRISWLDDENFEELFEEKITLTRELKSRSDRDSCRGLNSIWSLAQPQATDGEEVFGDTFLEDLKAGICRIPHNVPEIRASCPPLPRTPDTSREKTTDERQSLLPPDKTRRKEQTAYSKPGPPTPSKNARLSLQSTGRGMQRAALRESTGSQNRLSRLFGFSSFPKPKQPQPPSPKPKRRSFFGRRSTANRENVPPK